MLGGKDDDLPGFHFLLSCPVTGNLERFSLSFPGPLSASPNESWPKHVFEAQSSGRGLGAGERPRRWLLEGFRTLLMPRRQVWLSSKPQKEASCSNAGCWVTENLWAPENQDKFSEW